MEIQQSSDITYRVYDYDRVDANGKTRKLHLDDAKEVTTVPHKPAVPDMQERSSRDLISKKW